MASKSNVRNRRIVFRVEGKGLNPLYIEGRGMRPTRAIRSALEGTGFVGKARYTFVRESDGRRVSGAVYIPFAGSISR